jgi:hypothetical protein
MLPGEAALVLLCKLVLAATNHGWIMLSTIRRAADEDERRYQNPKGAP